MITVLRQLQQKIAGPVKPFAFLVVRILIGYAFFRAGWEKLTDLEAAAQVMKYAGVPLPEVNAIVVGIFESLVGLLTMAGLATRVASAIGIGILMVAILTVHTGEMAQLFSHPNKVVAAAPIPYLLAFLLLGTAGPGKFSVDKAIGLEGDD